MSGANDCVNKTYDEEKDVALESGEVNHAEEAEQDVGDTIDAEHDEEDDDDVELVAVVPITHENGKAEGKSAKSEKNGTETKTELKATDTADEEAEDGDEHQPEGDEETDDKNDEDNGKMGVEAVSPDGGNKATKRKPSPTAKIGSEFENSKKQKTDQNGSSPPKKTGATMPRTKADSSRPDKSVAAASKLSSKHDERLEQVPQRSQAV